MLVLGHGHKTVEEDIYFFTGLSMIKEDFPQFLDFHHGVVAESHLAYT